MKQKPTAFVTESTFKKETKIIHTDIRSLKTDVQSLKDDVQSIKVEIKTLHTSVERLALSHCGNAKRNWPRLNKPWPPKAILIAS